jgi:hypothetical protein
MSRPSTGEPGLRERQHSLGFQLTNLAQKPISETIRRLAADRRSGDLQVRSGELAKMVFFDNGQIVFAGSNLKADRLGEALVSLGQITDQQFERASGLMQEDRKLRFGDALVQAGVMDKKQVGTAVARYVAKIVLSLFRLDTGIAAFDERKCSIPIEYMVSLSTHRMLGAGIKSMSSRDLILAGVGNLDRPVRLAEVPPYAFEIKACSADEVDILEGAKARVSIRSLASTAKGLALARLRAVYAFLASGILEEGDARARVAAPQPAVQSDNRAFLLSPLQRGVEVASVEKASPVPAPAKAAAPAAAPTVAPPTPPAPAELQAPAPRATAPAPAVPSPPLHDVSGEVEQLLGQANVYLMVSDVGNALKAYARVVELQPDVAAHRVRLGALLGKLPQTARQAERHFAEAIRLDPNNVEAHFRFGAYYKAIGVPSRAIAEFRTVLRLDPRHQQARKELEMSSPRDSVLVTLKKLLG